MNHIVHKIYYNYEREEKWLNEMSSKGMAFTNYSPWKYVFTESQKNEYTYRLELLENVPTHPKSIKYIKFLEETGVECVATYMRWIYLRKKSSDGAFNIYSDIESKIKHYKRINVIWNSFMWIEFIIGIMNLVIGIVNLNTVIKFKNFSIGNFNIVVSSAPVLLGILFLSLSSKNRQKIKKLQQEKSIREWLNYFLVYVNHFINDFYTIKKGIDYTIPFWLQEKEKIIWNIW